MQLLGCSLFYYPDYNQFIGKRIVKSATFFLI